MGLLVDGVWRDQWYDTQSHGGRFERDAAKFRNWITPDGAPGPSGRGGFKAEPGRYHLYAAYFCPWAHRTLIFRELKGLAPLIDVSIVNWLMRENGITFAPADGVIGDPLFGARNLYEIYQAADPAYSGRVTVPTLWDKETKTIVSTESSEIIRMFNSAFDGVGAAAGDYYPPELRDEIDALNARIYPTVNNGVYRAGFATTQAAYEEAIGPLFETLDYLEALLAERRYLCGEQMTEADIRLLTTLLRFDIVYVGHFKCNVRRIADYPNLWAYVRDLYQTGTIANTFRPDHIKGHYYQSHLQINPTGIVSVGPSIDFSAPHDRARLGGSG
ncbi:Glutathione S-transferase domain protein [Methylocella silvestris BL2]|uniref:Glutathione S-transferase domain protein n=1 Tax=Methylocella silvestris (strain DSM 15510 / CIP 108128 / LMG 27833 / NCIMB 13906 / BL2) TaxID=395965 RepID=B8EQX4_METSB|nr:glutathione S-transferase family protein [Methylocella silvestris]ACK49395.1 Glutathione S-transferase domain protein [Methylocella silvestris BL2]